MGFSGGGGSGAPSGPASGDLSGTYPGPSVVAIDGVKLTGSAPVAGQVLEALSAATMEWVTGGGGPPTGAAGGDLSGAYPNPVVAQSSAGTFIVTETLQVDGSTYLYGTLQANGETLTGLAAPVNPSDAVTKAYADAIAQGLAVKPSVQLATVAALPANTYNNGASGVGATLTEIANGALTVDGIAVAAGNRILVQNEAAAANNGIYVVTAVGSAGTPYILTRASDMNTATEIPGAFAFTEEGSVNTGAGFVVASPGPFTIGTTAIAWTQFSGAGEILAGTGLTKAGNTLGLTTPVSIANGGTGQAAAAAAFAALSPLTTEGDLLYENATPAPGRLAIGPVNTSLQSNGTLPAWQLTLAQQATTGVGGYALVNGTGTIISWTAPADGNLHRFVICARLIMTGAGTGGALYAGNSGTILSGGSANSGSFLWNNNQGAGDYFLNKSGSGDYKGVLGPGETIYINQSSALTAGAGKLYAEIWGS
jgi:hypothetical protein